MPAARSFRDFVLQSLEDRLNPTKSLKGEEAMAERWSALERSSAESSFEEEQIKQWQAIGCAAEGAPYVLTALSKRLTEDTFNDSSTKRLARAFLDPACAGARGLSETTRAQLVELSQPTTPIAAPAQ
jgi:hypothetical protein